MIRLIHWKRQEAQVRAVALRRAGFAVDAAPLTPAEVRRLKENGPEAVVIDLSRLPSQGRDLALLLRQVKATRGIPLVLVAPSWRWLTPRLGSSESWVPCRSA